MGASWARPRARVTSRVNGPRRLSATAWPRSWMRRPTRSSRSPATAPCSAGTAPRTALRPARRGGQGPSDRRAPPRRGEARDERERRLARVFGHGETVRYEAERTGPRGRQLTLLVTISPVLEHDGAVSAACVLCRDMTEFQEIERRL